MDGYLDIPMDQRTLYNSLLTFDYLTFEWNVFKMCLLFVLRGGCFLCEKEKKD